MICIAPSSGGFKAAPYIECIVVGMLMLGRHPSEVEATEKLGVNFAVERHSPWNQWANFHNYKPVCSIVGGSEVSALWLTQSPKQNWHRRYPRLHERRQRSSSLR